MELGCADTMFGKSLMVRADGTIKVSEEDTKPLIGCCFTRV